ncbi:MAG: phosphotransferase, partial [Chloroflexota bacterium]
LHADFHLDNVVFDSQSEPVILDWARCAKGPLAFDLYCLMFDVSRLEDSESVLDAYVTAFAETAGDAPDVVEIQQQLAGVFLYDFALRTCGVAKWRPGSEREEVMIKTGIRRALRALDYWNRKEPELFAFITS